MTRTTLAIAAAAMCGSAAAAKLQPATLPRGEWLDTEVSTNICFALDELGASVFNFSLAFDATPSNNVEVAFGKDADGDGALGVCEASLSFAWDCGEWRLRALVSASADGGQETKLVEWQSPATGGVKHVEWAVPVRRGAVVEGADGVALLANMPGELGWLGFQDATGVATTPCWWLREGGAAVFPDAGTVPPSWLYDAGWDTVRLTVRGVDAPQEALKVEMWVMAFRVILR